MQYADQIEAMRDPAELQAMNRKARVWGAARALQERVPLDDQEIAIQAAADQLTAEATEATYQAALDQDPYGAEFQQQVAYEQGNAVHDAQRGVRNAVDAAYEQQAQQPPLYDNDDFTLAA